MDPYGCTGVFPPENSFLAGIYAKVTIIWTVN